MDKGAVIDTDEKYAYIAMQMNKSCGKCAGRGVCFAGDKPIPLKIKNEYGLKKGDVVELELSSQTKMSAGFLLFIVPIIFLIAGYYVGHRVSGTETSGIIGGGVGVIISALILKIVNKKVGDNNLMKPLSVTKIETGKK